MSSTNSSDRLRLLSYATFNYHIPIPDHSWRQHQWKQTETMVALASLALQSAKKLFQMGNLENKSMILCLELTFAHKVLVLIPTRIGDFIIFLWDISLDNETQPQGPRLRWRETQETHMFVSASQNTTLEKPLWRWHCISPAATAINQ